MSRANLDECLRVLDRRTKPSFHDRAFPRFVKCVNGFLRHLGKERFLLVGSTSEQLKIRWSKDGGDSDFLLLSGKLEVPVENVEFRKDTPYIIWVKVDRDKVERNIDLIENKYLPSDVLRSVGPELFTATRAFYLGVTRNASYVSNGVPFTTHCATSKVGLAVCNYIDLSIENSGMSTKRTVPQKQLTGREENFRKYIDKRLRDACRSFRKQDVEVLKTVLQIISSVEIPHDVGAGQWYWEHVTNISSLILQRFDSFRELLTLHSHEIEEGSVMHSDDDEAEEKCNDFFVNDFESPPEECFGVLNQSSTTTVCDSEKPIRKIRATFSETSCADFVPAIRLVGTLPCMKTWKPAEHRWLAPGEIEAICNMDVFFVARYVPDSPSRKKDFCLSFTLAENKLSECLSPVQRRVFLVMKAYLKGVITKMHNEQDRKLRLTTFHLKTILYRVCDITDPELWSEDNILFCIVNLVEYLKKALSKRELLHYFIGGNLFASFDDNDFRLLLACVEAILSDPVETIQPFFDLDDGIPNEIWLTEEEVQDLENLKTDVGISKEVDRIEEALVDLLRGLDEGPRDAEGSSAFKKAISTMIELYLTDEVSVESASLLGPILKLVDTFLEPSRNAEENLKLIFQPIIDALFKIGQRI